MTATTAATTARPPAPVRASQARIGWTIAARAVADRMTLVGVLGFYALAFGVAVGALWPPLEQTFIDLSASLPAAIEQLLGGVPMATPAGWMNAEMMSFLGPGILIAVAIISGGRAVAGEEDARTLTLVLSTSTGRGTFLAAKTVAMVAHVLLVSAALLAGMLLGNAIGGLGIGVGLLLAATAQTALVGLVFGSIALTLGVVGADRRLTTAISAGLAGLSLVLAVFLPLSPSLLWLAKLNFWYPYGANAALINGLDGGFAAVLVACAAAISAIGFVAFPRRDLRG